MSGEAEVTRFANQRAATRRNNTAHGNALGPGHPRSTKPCKGEIGLRVGHSHLISRARKQFLRKAYALSVVLARYQSQPRAWQWPCTSLRNASKRRRYSARIVSGSALK